LNPFLASEAAARIFGWHREQSYERYFTWGRWALAVATLTTFGVAYAVAASGGARADSVVPSPAALEAAPPATATVRDTADFTTSDSEFLR